MPLSKQQLLRKSLVYALVMALAPAILLVLMLVFGKKLRNFIQFEAQIAFGGVALLMLAIWFQVRQSLRAVASAELFEQLQQTSEELKQKRLQLDADMSMARNVLEGLLPGETPRVEGFEIAARCVPAAELGGDFYGFIHTHADGTSHVHGDTGAADNGDYLGIIIGDVAGHGVSSALVMALSNGLFGEVAKTALSPAEVLQRVNERMRLYIKDSEVSFVTAFYALLDIRGRRLTYSKAGHACPVLYRARDDHWEFLETSGIFLGMLPDQTYEEKSISLEPGDKVVFYTDGITETRNERGDLFQGGGIADVVRDYKNLSAHGLLDKLFQEVESFAGETVSSDDRAVVILGAKNNVSQQKE